jgi:hypothetical protein
MHDTIPQPPARGIRLPVDPVRAADPMTRRSGSTEWRIRAAKLRISAGDR